MMNQEIPHSKTSSKKINEASLPSFNYLDFLNQYLRPTGSYGMGKRSLREMAADLGYNSPSILTMILKGQRFPSRTFIDQFCEYFKINNTQKELLHLLVNLERKNSKGQDISDISNKIQRLMPDRHIDTVDVLWFKKVAGWHYTAIKNLIKTPYFIEDYDIISRQLKNRVTPKQVKEAIDLLLELEVIERNSAGELEVNTGSWRTPTGINSSAIRKFHKGMILEALYSLENENADRRFISGLTLQFDTSQKEEATADIMQFLNDFNTKYYKKDSKHLGQLNIQFFRLNKDLNKESISLSSLRKSEKSDQEGMIQ